MHELSIVMDLINLCEEKIKGQTDCKIKSIEVKIGRLSGIEPHLLESAFDVYKCHTDYKNVELIIHIQDIIVSCNNCLEQNSLPKNEFLCPKCGSDNLKVIDGEDMYLMRLNLQENT